MDLFIASAIGVYAGPGLTGKQYNIQNSQLCILGPHFIFGIDVLDNCGMDVSDNFGMGV